MAMDSAGGVRAVLRRVRRTRGARRSSWQPCGADIRIRIFIQRHGSPSCTVIDDTTSESRAIDHLSDRLRWHPFDRYLFRRHERPEAGHQRQRPMEFDVRKSGDFPDDWRGGTDDWATRFLPDQYQWAGSRPEDGDGPIRGGQLQRTCVGAIPSLGAIRAPSYDAGPASGRQSAANGGA